MPEASNAPQPTPTPHPRMRRLIRAGSIIKSLATIFIVAFLFAYAHTTLKYGTPHPQTTASISHPIAHPSFFTPTRYRITHQRRAFFRPTRRPVRHTTRRPRRSSPYYLASLRRLRHFFTRVLAV
ncbi:MAG: hypothetical protein WBY53_02355 [Acidobacteriaceae bacterium]